MEREATDLAPKAVLRQLRRTPTPPSPESDARDDDLPQRTRRASVSSVTSSPTTKSTKSPTKDVRTTSWAEPQVGLLVICAIFLDHCARCQPFEVLRAIERKDVIYLMEIRDRSFPVSETELSLIFFNRYVSSSYGRRVIPPLFSMQCESASPTGM